MRASFGAFFLWLVTLVYFTQGFRSFVWTAISYQMKDILKLSPSSSQFLVSVAHSPWSIKPIYGIAYNVLICPFKVPLCVMVAWITGIKMDLDLNLLETGSLIMAILVIAFTLQSQLNEAILREDYGEAAKLKLAITGATKRILLEQH
ncbi:hypothetical protein ZIOFF_040133 [Zingiber officinale]|uniref:Uncharacterized protein n=1 Tax=Zingiber officinale TaxID=94328 RepID=A0A8J5L4B0_ZINOF|nr:hypothetical protein ZIOFF_040133 [Zingiber officinale]